MVTIEFLLELTGGSILLVVFGCLAGHRLKLDKFSDNRQKSRTLQLRKTDVETDESGDQV